MLTLTAIAARAGISQVTAGKYKRRFADRIPSTGEGRRQRYPEEAVPVFAQLRVEQEARRGRPKKSALRAQQPREVPTP